MNQCLCCGSESLDAYLVHFCSYSCANAGDIDPIEDESEECVQDYVARCGEAEA